MEIKNGKRKRKRKQKQNEKLNEVIDYPRSIYARSRILGIFDRYNNKEVVTSYIENDFGCMFILKGKVKAFAFVVLKRELCSSYYNVEELTPNKYFKMREEMIKDKTTITILDDKAEETIKAKCMLIELQKIGGNN